MLKATFVFLLGCTLMKAGSMEREAAAFLNRWLVDGDVEKALRYVSDRGSLCIPGTKTNELSTATPAEAKERLRVAMTTVLQSLGKRANLSEVIGPVPSILGHFVGKTGAGGLPFTVWDAPESDLRAITCNSSTRRTLGVIAFVFRGVRDSEPAGGMYIVFENGLSRKWRVIGFNALRQ